jgi:hypothetical protein
MDDSVEWYYVTKFEQQQGPATPAEFKAEYDAGNVNEECLCWNEDFGDDWNQVGDIDFLMAYFKPPPPKPKRGAPPGRPAAPPGRPAAPPKPSAPARPAAPKGPKGPKKASHLTSALEKANAEAMQVQQDIAQKYNVYFDTHDFYWYYSMAAGKK